MGEPLKDLNKETFSTAMKEFEQRKDELTIPPAELIEVLKSLKGIERKLQALLK